MDSKTLASVQSLQRAFSLVELLAEAPAGLSLSDIAARSGLHKSTAHRLLGCLETLGYVRHGSQYSLTLKLFELGSSVVDSMDVVELSKPILHELSARIGETVHLVIRNGTDGLYVFKSESRQNSLRMVSYIGKHRPLYCTAAGKVILSTLTDAEVIQVWRNSDIVAHTTHTITRVEDLLVELARVRAMGYAIDDEESEMGVRCIAGGLRDFRGLTEAAFTISGPVSRMTDERLREIGEEVRCVQQVISGQLGSTRFRGKE